MSTRPPGYFFRTAKRAVAAVAGFFKRTGAPARTVLELPWSPGHGRRTPGAFGNRLWNRRSQYDVRHAQPGISYAEHDAHVRDAMCEGHTRCANMVDAGWRSPRVPQPFLELPLPVRL